MFCEETQEKSQCFCASSALLHLTLSIVHNFVLFLVSGLRRVAQSVGIYTECQKHLSVSYSCRD